MKSRTVSKIYSPEKLAQHLSDIREGKTVVLAAGCFDVLHVGHIRYIQAASELGDIIVVAANDDAAISEMKGENKPVIPEYERAEMLASLEGVHYVTIYPSTTTRDLLLLLKPDIYAKGTDYKNKKVPWTEEVEQYGGKVMICGDEKTHSSTEIIARL